MTLIINISLFHASNAKQLSSLPLPLPPFNVHEYRFINFSSEVNNRERDASLLKSPRESSQSSSSSMLLSTLIRCRIFLLLLLFLLSSRPPSINERGKKFEVRKRKLNFHSKCDEAKKLITYEVTGKSTNSQ
jgi:hypothetical protein